MNQILKGLIFIGFCIGCSPIISQTYHIPGEDLEHEGTWLQWPHNELYGPWYQGDVEEGWVVMTNSLQSGENVHIIALNVEHQNHIVNLLNDANVPLDNVDFYIFPTDDVWIRDNGPIFVYDENNNLSILDWGFNGWGNDAPYSNCDIIPESVSNATGIPNVDLSAMVLEGGAIEHDGQGTLIATRSSITHSSRNPNLSEQEIEDYMTEYLGFTNFIWLDGVYGSEITDMHIDGFVKFANENTIVTMDDEDLTYWELSTDDKNTLSNATNADGEAFNFVIVPLTQNNVTPAWGGGSLGYKGSYCNYYIGNEVVIVPVYNDPNDAVAMDIIQGVHPDRNVVGMNVQNLYEYGGMTHCVTQQQPISLNPIGTDELDKSELRINRNYPNPCSESMTINFDLDNNSRIELTIYNTIGEKIQEIDLESKITGNNTYILDVSNFESGMYSYQLSSIKTSAVIGKFVVQK